MAVIETMGIEGGRAKTFRLKSERLVEEKEIDPATGQAKSRVVVQPFELSVPLLALLPVSPIQLQEMEVDFGIEVVEPKTEPIRSTSIPSTVLGSTLAGSMSVFTALGQSNPTTMKVHMRITKETPEGIARMGDLLTDLLSGKPEAGPRVDDIPGLPAEAATTLKDRGIFTASAFLEATKTTEPKAEIAKALGVSRGEIDIWRQESRKLLKKA